MRTITVGKHYDGNITLRFPLEKLLVPGQPEPETEEEWEELAEKAFDKEVEAMSEIEFLEALDIQDGDFDFWILENEQEEKNNE